MDVLGGHDVEALLGDYRRSFQIGRWLHPERFPEELPPALYRWLCSVRRTKETVEAWLWRRLGLARDVVPAASESRWGFAFLGGEQLRELQLYLGACGEAEAMARVVRGPEVSALKQSLGEAVYHFALHRVPVLLKTALPAFPESIGENLRVEERVERKRQWILEALLADAPPALLERFVLQFPKDGVWDFSHGADEDGLVACRQLVEMILTKVMPLPTSPQKE